MAASTNAPRRTQGRARGLLLVWRRELECKLRINNYLWGCRRGETLQIMTEGRPGDWQLTSDQPGIEDSHMESTQTWWWQMGPHVEETPQRLSGTWPKYLGRGVHINPPSLPRIEAQPPSPTLSTTSSNSSGPPSLESLTELESGYEASVFSSSDTK